MDPDLKKTKLFIDSMKLGAGGWKQGKVGDGLPGPHVYLYLIDQPGPEHWVWMCSCARDGFVQTSTDASADTAQWQQYRNALSGMLHDLTRGVIPPPVQGHDWETQLAMVASAYAGTTKVWQLADALKGGGHFIVLNYRAKGASVGNLRPFCLPGDGDANSALPVGDLMQMVIDVMIKDMNNHPEWFVGMT